MSTPVQNLNWEAWHDKCQQELRADRRPFSSAQKATLEFCQPKWTSYLLLLVTLNFWSCCQAGGVWESCMYPWIPSQVQPVVWVPVIEKHCSIKNLVSHRLEHQTTICLHRLYIHILCQFSFPEHMYWVKHISVTQDSINALCLIRCIPNGGNPLSQE